MLNRDVHPRAALEAGPKGSRILHPFRGTGRRAEGTWVPAGAGKGVSGKGHAADGLEPVHSVFGKTSGRRHLRSKPFEADGLAPGKSFGPGNVILIDAFAQSPKSSAAFQDTL